MQPTRLCVALIALTLATPLACKDSGKGERSASADEARKRDEPAAKQSTREGDDDDDGPAPEKKRTKKPKVDEGSDDTDKSERAVEKPASTDTGGYDAAVKKARDLMAKKEYDAAIAAYDDACASRRDAVALGERGYAKVLAKRWDEGLKDLDAARDKTDDAKVLGPIWFDIGLAREGKGDRAGAIAAYRRSNELRPTKAAQSKLTALGDAGDAGDATPLECRAKGDDGANIELRLLWKDGGDATGTLSVGGKTQAVAAQLYKGLILVDAPGTTNLTGKLATVTTDGKKTIRLGDYKQPTHDCL